jgi:hypothetical protein
MKVDERFEDGWKESGEVEGMENGEWEKNGRRCDGMRGMIENIFFLVEHALRGRTETGLRLDW